MTFDTSPREIVNRFAMMSRPLLTVSLAVTVVTVLGLAVRAAPRRPPAPEARAAPAGGELPAVEEVALTGAALEEEPGSLGAVTLFSEAERARLVAYWNAPGR